MHLWRRPKGSDLGKGQYEGTGGKGEGGEEAKPDQDGASGRAVAVGVEGKPDEGLASSSQVASPTVLTTTSTTSRPGVGSLALRPLGILKQQGARKARAPFPDVLSATPATVPSKRRGAISASAGSRRSPGNGDAIRRVTSSGRSPSWRKRWGRSRAPLWT